MLYMNYVHVKKLVYSLGEFSTLKLKVWDLHHLLTKTTCYFAALHANRLSSREAELGDRMPTTCRVAKPLRAHLPVWGSPQPNTCLPRWFLRADQVVSRCCATSRQESHRLPHSSLFLPPATDWALVSCVCSRRCALTDAHPSGMPRLHAPHLEGRSGRRAVRTTSGFRKYIISVLVKLLFFSSLVEEKMALKFRIWRSRLICILQKLTNRSPLISNTI